MELRVKLCGLLLELGDLLLELRLAQPGLGEDVLQDVSDNVGARVELRLEPDESLLLLELFDNGPDALPLDPVAARWDRAEVRRARRVSGGGAAWR